MSAVNERVKFWRNIDFSACNSLHVPVYNFEFLHHIKSQTMGGVLVQFDLVKNAFDDVNKLVPELPSCLHWP